MNTTLKELPTQELKALVYDTLVEIERHQKNLQLLNQEIAGRQASSPQDAPKKVEEKPTEAAKKK